MVRFPVMRPALTASLAALLLVSPAVGHAEAASAAETPAAATRSAEDIQGCVQKNFPSTTAVQRMEFRSQDRAGGGRTIHSRVKWRRFEDGFSRILTRVSSPQDLKGSGVLLIEKKKRADMFVYLPDLEKVRRVTSRMLSGSMFGSDFTFEDFSQLQGMAVEGRSERLDDATVGEVPVYVVAHYPAEGSGSAYERVVSFIETESCVALKSEMYEDGDRLRKVMTAERESIFEQDGVRLPQKILMKDLRDESQTELLISEIEVGGKVPKKTFSITTLERPRVNE